MPPLALLFVSNLTYQDTIVTHYIRNNYGIISTLNTAKQVIHDDTPIPKRYLFTRMLWIRH